MGQITVGPTTLVLWKSIPPSSFSLHRALKNLPHKKRQHGGSQRAGTGRAGGFPTLSCFCSCGVDGVEALSISRLPPPQRGCRDRNWSRIARRGGAPTSTSTSTSLVGSLPSQVERCSSRAARALPRCVQPTTVVPDLRWHSAFQTT
jgi:hypothetical protein